MVRTIRTCSLGLAGALILAAVPAEARVTTFVRSGASTFVAAQAAANAGDARRAAMLYASLAAAEPGNRTIANRALAQAILAGDMPLALRLARATPGADLAPDARLLLLADDLRERRPPSALAAGWPDELGFVTPFVRAWTLSERGKRRDALAALDNVARDNLLAPLVPEHKALILLANWKAKEAQAFIPTALGRAGGRGDRLRILFASGLLRAGSRDAALALLRGRDVTLAAAATQLSAQRRPDFPAVTAAQGFGELLSGLAVLLNQSERSALPLSIVQVARFSDPANEQTAILLGLLLAGSDRSDDALAVLRRVPDSSPLASEARDAEIRTLLRAERRPEALARAQAFVAGARVTADDWSRLGDVFDAMARHGEAADAFANAARLTDAGGPGPERWSLYLLRGASLEQAGRWTEAEKSLEAAHALAPDNPVVLNYLGYARLERGVRLDEAEALIAEASRRAPDDASITDSLGWAQFKRGKLPEAIATLQRAAAADPGQAEIHEHLGDALYTAGRLYEARFAWSAALVTAEDDVRKRIEAKIAAGLTPTTAAP
ncbi:tetratricopeptide repeat protein [Sphingomonas swuensis]|uniref:Tetratricopeptide repeat protein n=1 Tax=Sphingomonas swuensis TaxID=977800 RepID=A0ABP7STA0_9SPHN